MKKKEFVILRQDVLTDFQNQIDPYNDFSWKDGKTEIRNLWFYKRWNLAAR